MEYHPHLEVANPHCVRSAHLIRPSPDSPKYASAEGLAPFRRWARLTNADTFIDGPFEFAVINGHKSRDRVSADNWKVLLKHRHLFANEVPGLDLPDYSVHCGQFHTSFDSKPIGDRVSAFLANPSTPDMV